MPSWQPEMTQSARSIATGNRVRTAIQIARLCLGILLALSAPLRAEEPGTSNAAVSPGVHDVALFLAGMEPTSASSLHRLTRNTAWQDYAARVGRGWNRFEKGTLAKIRTFGAATGIGLAPSVLYPFGGPDLAFAMAFYPGATTYVLCGLESATPLPSRLDDATLRGLIPRLRSTLLPYLAQGFFQTEAMRSVHRFAGVAPLLMVAAVRGGAHIDAIETVYLGADGEVRDTADSQFNLPGLRLRMTAGGVRKSVLYFRVNLANRSLAGSPFARFIERASPFVSLLKGASYLPHEADFSTISALLLDHSKVLVEDDTGVPFDRFASGAWRIRLFGRYRSPHGAFARYHQPLLAAQPVTAFEPLDFDFGYDTRSGRSHLLVAIKVAPGAR